jgi:hypothetical protein
MKKDRENGLDRNAALALLLESLGQEVRFGLRILGKNLGFTTVTVTALAIGMSVNTAVFTLFDAEGQPAFLMPAVGFLRSAGSVDLQRLFAQPHFDSREVRLIIGCGAAERLADLKGEESPAPVFQSAEAAARNGT